MGFTQNEMAILAVADRMERTPGQRMGRKRKPLSKDERDHVIGMLNAGYAVCTISKSLNISRDRIRREFPKETIK